MNKYNPDDIIVVKDIPVVKGVVKDQTLPKHKRAIGLAHGKDNNGNQIFGSIDNTLYAPMNKYGTIKKIPNPYRCKCGKIFNDKPRIAEKKYAKHIQHCKEIENGKQAT